jgi:MFS family permease
MAFRPPGLSQAGAGQVISIAFVICALVTPLFGRFVDRHERANILLVSSSFLLCLTHATFMSYHHAIVMVFLGMGYAGLVASVWPLVPFTVGEEHVGLAYGIMTALQNLGLTLMPLSVRLIVIHLCITSIAGLDQSRNRIIRIHQMAFPCCIGSNPFYEPLVSVRDVQTN